jgi:iron complex outermembrane receptor protein
MGDPPRGGCRLITSLLVLAVAGPAGVAEPREPIVAIDIDAVRLDRALNELAKQADIDIVLATPALARKRARTIRGRMTAQQALARLLSDLHAVAVPLRGGGWRVEARAPPRRSVSIGRMGRPASQIVAPASDILVTGSKHGTALWEYPGSAVILDLGGEDGARIDGSDAIVRLSSTVDSTHFGPGRNKLIIRGISDSAFLGPLQSTVGQYLGDVRLTYGVPDPDLQLVDIASVEVLEGPQATLYGAGSLGGVVRIIPEGPDVTATEGRFSSGLSATAHGDPGYDASAMVNLPISGAVGVRLVGYTRGDGGFVDDIRRDRRDINRVKTKGLRSILRAEHDDWTIDLGQVVQTIVSTDTAALPLRSRTLERSSAIAQPYKSRFALTSLTLQREWGGLRLSSATGFSTHRLRQVFDASALADSLPSFVVQRDRSRTFASETRLADDSSAVVTWVAGLAFTQYQSAASYDYSGSSEPSRSRRSQTRVSDAALFGEATLAVGANLKVTGGARVSRTRISGRAGSGSGEVVGPPATESRFTPSVGFHWEVLPSLAFFARYQQGFRAGGYTGLPTDMTRLASDRVKLIETGARMRSDDRLEAELTLAQLRWHDVQGDSLSLGGDIVSRSMGTATIHSLGLKAKWRPDDRLAVAAGLFFNRNRLRNSELGNVIVENARLPGVARVAANIDVTYHRDLGQGWAMHLAGGLRYFGHSELGAGAVFGQLQGGYSDLEASLRIADGRRTISLGIVNPLDGRGNRLAFANPFRLFDPQYIPVRPLTARIGWELRF